VAPDEGHGFARPVNNKAMFAAAEKFLAKHLNGRYQESMPDEVAARLKEITVDPKTVVLAKKVDPGAVGLPQVATGLTPGAYKYLARIKMGEREMKLDTSTEIRREGDAWKVTDRVAMPNGEVVDEVLLDGNTLALVRRVISQGLVNFNLEIKDAKLTGSMKVQGNEKPVDVDLGGPLFADAAGAAHAIAALPLAEGYETRFRNFDVMKQKPKLMQLKVTGQETVTVPAGTFDTWRVDLTSAEGGPEKMTVWVAKGARKPVKTSAVMSQMGGATMTAELQ
jgi:hypothetical protein